MVLDSGHEKPPFAAGLRGSSTIVWLSLSLAVVLIHAGLGLVDGLSSPYAIQSDARQYVTWTVRFQDSTYFPDDLIADYFETVSPPGYRLFFWWLTSVGTDPFLLAKLLPVALGLIVTAYAFRLSLHLLPSAPAAFAATVILNQNLWMTDDLISATPRAFGFPILVAFLYYLAKRSLVGTVVTVALGGLFYPQLSVIAAGTLVLSLVVWRNGRPALSVHRRDLLICAAGVLAALALLTLSATRASTFGSAMHADEARILPVFLPGGRAEFFFDDPWDFWVTKQRSGFLRQPFGPPLVWAGLLLPVLILARRYFPLARRIVDGARPLPHLLVASFGLFFLAHALLFRLYLPSRYAQHSVRIALSIAAGLAVAIVAHRMLALIRHWGARHPRRPAWLLAGLAQAALLLVLLAPTIAWVAEGGLPDARYRRGDETAVYSFLAAQPHATMVASLTEVADFIPPLARRSVVIAPKYAVPYHSGYHREMERRARDLIRAQYSPDLRELQDITRQYGIDYWLVRRVSFSTEYVDNTWINDFRPEASAVSAQLRQGDRPALERLMDRCAVLTVSNLVMIQAECILASPIELLPAAGP